jgi:hypothetical protein
MWMLVVHQTRSEADRRGQQLLPEQVFVHHDYDAKLATYRMGTEHDQQHYVSPPIHHDTYYT